MAKTHSRSLTQPYEAALKLVLEYVWEDERRDFEASPRPGHVFPALQAARAWLERGNASFPLGTLVATPGAFETIDSTELEEALERHCQGDWGALDEEDWQANERALEQGGRLFSVYFAKSGSRFWIITEADRTVTTVLLPEDY